MTETYEQSVERRARELDPTAFEAVGPYSKIWNGAMITCGSMHAEDSPHWWHYETTPEAQQESARYVITSCDADDRAREAQVSAQMAAYKAAGYFDRKPLWRRLLGL
jgi:hypothetical protein